MSKSRFLRIDMHVHTKHSDGMSPVAFLLRKARKKGIGFAITDHNTIDGVIEAYLIKEKSDLVVPGIELHTKEGPHFLLYFNTLDKLRSFYELHVIPNKGADPFSRTKLGIADIVRIVGKCDCVIAIAHPAGRLWTNVEKVMKKKGLDGKILRKIHAAETISGQMSKQSNKKAYLFKLKYDLAEIGGSDAHSIGEFGRVLTLAECDDIKGFLKKIREKKSIAIGKENRIYKKAFSSINILKTHLTYTAPYLKDKINNHGGIIPIIREINYNFYGLRPTVKFIKGKIALNGKRRENG